MAAKQSKTVGPLVSDYAVRARTGKNWKEWFAILDKAGAKKMNHKEIVAYLKDHHNVGPWWLQTVTVTYEQVRGLRDKHQKPEGYQISVSRTITTGVGNAFDAFGDEKIRRRWLSEKELTVRKATRPKSLRITWTDTKTSVEVNLYAKGNDKSQVTVQHSKLPDEKEAAAKKVYWSDKLDALKRLFDSGK